MEQQVSQKKGIHYAWILLAVIVIVRGFTVSIVNYFPALLYTPISTAFGTGLTQVSLITSISALTLVVMNPIGGKFISRPGLDLRKVLMLSLALIGIALAGFSVATELWMLYLLCIIYSAGNTIGCTLICTTVVNSWFIKQRGLAIGLLTASSGIFGIFVLPIITDIIASAGWQSASLYAGGAIAIIGIPLVFLFMRIKPSDKGLLAYGSENQPINHNAPPKKATVLAGLSAKEALKCPAFYCIAGAVMCFMLDGSFLNLLPSAIINAGYTAETAGSVMSILMMGVSVGAVVVGLFNDKIGSIPTLVALCITSAVALTLMLLAIDVMPILLLAAVMMGVVISGGMVVIPLIISDLFGTKEFSQIFGYLLAFLYFDGVVMPPVFSALFDATGSFQIPMTIIIVAGIIGAILALSLRKVGPAVKARWNA